MTIDEAIKILTQEAEEYEPSFAQPQIDAINLGIEALKYTKMTRTTQEFRRDTLLPGETEEGS